MTNKELLDKIYNILQAKKEKAFAEWDSTLSGPIGEFNQEKVNYCKGKVYGLCEATDVLYDLYKEIMD